MQIELKTSNRDVAEKIECTVSKIELLLVILYNRKGENNEQNQKKNIRNINGAFC